LKGLLILLIAVGIAIGVSAQASAQINIGDTTGYFGIVIDGKTRNIELTRVDPKDNLESDLKHMEYVGVHSLTGVYAKSGPFSNSGGFVSKGHSNLPPNSSIADCRLNALGFVAREVQKEDNAQKRKSAIATKLDEIRKDGTYVAIIERTTIGSRR
jgi:hypothetical protein